MQTERHCSIYNGMKEKCAVGLNPKAVTIGANIYVGHDVNLAHLQTLTGGATPVSSLLCDKGLMLHGSSGYVYSSACGAVVALFPEGRAAVAVRRFSSHYGRLLRRSWWRRRRGRDRGLAARRN